MGGRGDDVVGMGSDFYNKVLTHTDDFCDLVIISFEVWMGKATDKHLDPDTINSEIRLPEEEAIITGSAPQLSYRQLPFMSLNGRMAVGILENLGCGNV